MEIEDLFKDRSNENISAFAFNIGRMIEDTIHGKVGEISQENLSLKAKIFTFRSRLAHLTIPNGDVILKEFENHFGIVEAKGG